MKRRMYIPPQRGYNFSLTLKEMMMNDSDFITLREEAIASFAQFLREDTQFFGFCIALSHLTRNKDDENCIEDKTQYNAAKETRELLKSIDGIIVNHMRNFKRKK